MRLLCLLTVTLTAAIASADAHSVNFEVVHVLPDTQQVLVLDKERNTHVLLTIGSAVGDDVVVDIDGIGMTLETRENERFTVYPRAAQGLALNLDKGAKKDLPAVYSSIEAPVAPEVVAQNLEEFADTLASVFFTPVPEDVASEGVATSSMIVGLK